MSSRTTVFQCTLFINEGLRVRVLSSKFWYLSQRDSPVRRHRLSLLKPECELV